MSDGVLVPIEDEEHDKENVSCDGPATCSCRQVRYEIQEESSESSVTSAPVENASPIPIPSYAAVESAETSSGSTRVVGLQRCIPSRNHLKGKRFHPYSVTHSSVAASDVGYRGSIELSPSPDCVGKGSSDTGGEGCWKPAITLRVHLDPWLTVLKMFLTITF